MWIPSLKLSIGEEIRCPSRGTYGRASPYVLRESLSLCSFLAIQDSSEPTHSNKAWDNPLKRKELSCALGAIGSLPVLIVKSTWAQCFYRVWNGKPFQCPYCLEKLDARYREKRSVIAFPGSVIEFASPLSLLILCCDISYSRTLPFEDPLPPVWKSVFLRCSALPVKAPRVAALVLVCSNWMVIQDWFPPHSLKELDLCSILAALVKVLSGFPLWKSEKSLVANLEACW